MNRDQVIQRPAGARAELAGLGVPSLDLFGSVARGEADPDSEVDLLIDFDKPFEAGNANLGGSSSERCVSSPSSRAE